MYEILLLITAIGAGFLGALLGLGGGIIIVPVLTLVYHIDIRYAIAASLISIVATSSGAAASYLKDSLTNLRLAVFLEIGTVSGAIVGFLLATYIKAQFLFLLFGTFLFFSALMMLRKRHEHYSAHNHPWAEKLRLDGGFPEGGEWKAYKVEHVPLGLFAMFGAGILSALLGIGSGIFKVLAMDGAMKLPIKVSSATSNFMIGVTASASAGAYLLKGDVRPEIAAPVAVGIIIGSMAGAKAMVKMPAGIIRKIFVVVLSIVSVQMIMKGLK
ncbi:sulfite exporter TauE/SafE family protein [Bdellovibrio sp. KM01]|uniref:sulfite exporter TauE/SafE family protein n=1 Tax=Bdellovibrio sp. KM01 TaxID=2748865 RepID=UPI0015EAE902|nr:sulfite exporter TauE/SafE family protein [Bdellovibrio sp. KM01]QLY23976.1 sulfite exporter TauE/SafE family protein [Bdellovibrio sp. KM01]